MVPVRSSQYADLAPPFIVFADILLLTTFVLILLSISQVFLTNKDALRLAEVGRRQEELAEQAKVALGGLWGDDIRVTADQKDQKFTFADRILFDIGSDELNEKGQNVLKKFAEVLKSKKHLYNTIRVEGHTCTLPITSGRFRSNWHLSAARAVAVVHFLAKQGISEKRMSANGFGQFHPVAPNCPKEGNPKNRRIEIVLVYEYRDNDKR